MGKNQRASLPLGFGDSWRDHRRLFHQYFLPGVVRAYHPKSYEEAQKLLPRLLSQPDDFMQHIRTLVFLFLFFRMYPPLTALPVSMTASIILGITFGMEIEPVNDPYVSMAEQALHAMAEVGNVGSYMGAYSKII